MTRSMKILLGIATLWPLIYMFVFMAFVFSMIFLAGNPDSAMGPLFGGGFFLIFIVHFLTIILTIGLAVYYIVHAIKNESLDTNMKAMWAVLFFFFGMIAQPIYWYMNIWKGPDDVGPPGLLGSAPTSTWDFESQRARQGEYQPPNEPPDWR